jgi:hypothetical protein
MRFRLRQLQVASSAGVRRYKLALGLTFISFAFISISGAGQDSPAKPLPLAISSLRVLNRNAGYIFDGTVLSVEPVAQDETGSVATVAITFRIEEAIRGTHFGQVLTIREWSGLWNAEEHYQTGERVLLFLYRPSKLGLTSPVGGPMGRFAVDSDGNALLQRGYFPSLALGPAARKQLRQTNRVNARAVAVAVQRADSE